MIRLPHDLSAVSNVRLAYYEAATERDLRAAMKATRDARFTLALRAVMRIDAEIERRDDAPSFWEIAMETRLTE